MAKKNAGKKTKSTKVEEILGHRRVGHTMQLKIQVEGAKAARWVDADKSNTTKKMLSDYKKKAKAEVAEKNEEKQERREAAKPEQQASKRGRSVKKINYSLKALRDAYEPVSSDSEDEFEVAEALLEKEESRREAARVAKSLKRKRSSSEKTKSNRKGASLFR